MIFTCTLLILLTFSMSSIATYGDDDDDNNWTNRQIKSTDEVKSRSSSVLSYQEFLINEASYKFWAVFQMVTVAVLLYSTFAAIYYARYQYLMNLEAGNYDDLLFARYFPNSPPALDIYTIEMIINSIAGDY